MSVLAVPSIASTSSESDRGWDVFERFTEQARRVIAHAQEEAQLLEHDYIGPEHLLIGLNHAGTGAVAEFLESSGISLGAMAFPVGLAKLAAAVEDLAGQAVAGLLQAELAADPAPVGGVQARRAGGRSWGFARTRPTPYPAPSGGHRLG